MPDLDDVRRVALAFPGVEEGTSYGTVSFRVRKAFLARTRDDDSVLVLRVSFDEQAALLEEDPETFFLTPHYEGWPGILIRLAGVDLDQLAELFEDAWRAKAPRRLMTEYDARG